MERGEWESAHTLLDLGADPDPPRISFDQQQPLLFRAMHSRAHSNAPKWGAGEMPCINGHETVIRRIMRLLGVDLNKVGWGGHTPPLTWCAKTMYRSTSTRGVVPLLVGLGSDVNGIDRSGNTVLHNLVKWMEPVRGDLFENSRVPIVFVLNHGGNASLSVRNYEGFTPVELLIRQLSTLAAPAKMRRIQILLMFLRFQCDLDGDQVGLLFDALEELSLELEGSIPPM